MKRCDRQQSDPWCVKARSWIKSFGKVDNLWCSWSWISRPLICDPCPVVPSITDHIYSLDTYQYVLSQMKDERTCSHAV